MVEPKTQPYYPHIDGLRALAVMAVLIYHVFPTLLPGGFIGVDVFFVISGFLISSIIFREVHNNTFSIRVFYQKRIRRIFPALILVLFSCLFVGFIYFFSDEMHSLGKETEYSALSIANLLFKRELDYFNHEADLHFKPLLHLWSLGVEEQFYLIWPLFLMFFARKKGFFISLIVLTLGSFCLSIYKVSDNRIQAFYVLTYRFWELSLGGVIAYFTLYSLDLKGAILGRGGGIKGSIAPHVASLLGVSLILYGFCTFDARVTLFPGWAALVPTLGAALIILGGGQAWINHKILSHRILVFIGLISYPLYLWHWPLLVINRIFYKTPSQNSLIFCLFLSFLLAVATHYIIEKNIRYRKKAWLPLLITMALLGGLGFLIRKSYIPDCFFVQDQRVSIKGDWLYPDENDKLHGFPVRVLNKSGTGGRILCVGDSNMEQYYPRVQVLLSPHPKAPQVTFLTRGSCPPIPGLRQTSWHPLCDYMNKIPEIVKKGGFKKIILSGAWMTYLTCSSYYMEGKVEKIMANTPQGQLQIYGKLGDLIRILRQEGVEVVVILNIPRGEIDPHPTVHRSLFEKAKMTYRDFDFTLMKQKYGELQKKLKDIALRHGSTVVDPWDYLCSDKKCACSIDGITSSYKDGGHLSATFTRDHVTYLDSLFLPLP